MQHEAQGYYNSPPDSMNTGQCFGSCSAAAITDETGLVAVTQVAKILSRPRPGRCRRAVDAAIVAAPSAARRLCLRWKYRIFAAALIFRMRNRDQLPVSE